MSVGRSKRRIDTCRTDCPTDMKVRLLPSNVIDPKGMQSLTSFLIDDTVAVDGGSLGFALPPEELYRVRNVILTHTHIDHIASLPVFISEVFHSLDEPISLFATRESIECLRKHIFNNRIWPDFEQIRLSNGNGTGLRFVEIEPGLPFKVLDLEITAVRTNHTVPTIGVAIEKEGAAVILSSDTYVTKELWQLANQLENLGAIFVDVSYPNEMAELAKSSKHLTPEKLDGELRALKREIPVFAVHLRHLYREQISRQLQELGRSNLYIGEIDRDYRITGG